jgi:hypothetical protein
MKIKKSAGRVPDFHNGQVWRMGADRLQIELVGKWLVHYRQFTALNKKLPTQFTARGDLEKLLRAHKAVLVQGNDAMDKDLHARSAPRGHQVPPVRPACAGARRYPRG